MDMYNYTVRVLSQRPRTLQDWSVNTVCRTRSGTVASMPLTARDNSGDTLSDPRQIAGQSEYQSSETDSEETDDLLPCFLPALTYDSLPGDRGAKQQAY